MGMMKDIIINFVKFYQNTINRLLCELWFAITKSEFCCISGVRQQILNELVVLWLQITSVVRKKIRESFWCNMKVLMFQSWCGDYWLVYYVKKCFF